MPPTAPFLSNGEHIARLLALFTARQSFVITSHQRPDGDAIGSTLGLMHLLETMGKHVDVCLADPVPPAFRALPGAERLTTAPPAAPPDCVILLETGSYDRSGFPPAWFAAAGARESVNIDHHRSCQPFADHNWIDADAPAVGAMLYDLAVASGEPLSAALATCLYTAVLTDTGSFAYAGTTAATFGLAQHLVELGASPHKIAEAVLFSNPAQKLRVLGAVFSRMQVRGDVAWSSITLAELAHAGATSEDCEGAVTHLIGIDGIRAAAFLRETAPGTEYRANLRSKGPVDVSAVAMRFGGGGHRNASGCNLELSLQESEERLVTALMAATAAVSEPAPALIA